MRARLMALAAAAILFLFPIQPGFTTTNQPNQSNDQLSDLDLPSALSEDDSFNDLPFEQLRQALREEVEYGPQKGISPRSFKRYNLIIR
mgnify:CR=1 FL=1